MNEQELTDYRAFYDSTYVRAWDIPPGRDAVCVIERVVAVEIKGVDKTERRPVVYFRDKQKGLVLNKGMGKMIKGMYGRFTKDWLGKPIAIYATQVTAFGETHDVVRVRPQVPQKPSGKKPKTDAPALPAAPIADAEYEPAEGQKVAS